MTELVHNHGSEEGRGLACRETRQHDGTLRGACIDGLREKYHVRRIGDAAGKHDLCRFFVLDPQHDPIARMALLAYADDPSTPRALRSDLLNWLGRVTPHGATD